MRGCVKNAHEAGGEKSKSKIIFFFFAHTYEGLLEIHTCIYTYERYGEFIENQPTTKNFAFFSFFS